MVQIKKRDFFIENEEGRKESVKAFENPKRGWTLLDENGELLVPGFYKLVCAEDNKTRLFGWSTADKAFLFISSGVNISPFKNAALLKEEKSDCASLYIWIEDRLLEQNYGVYSCSEEGIRIGNAFYPQNREYPGLLWHRPHYEKRKRKGFWKRIAEKFRKN